MLIDTNSIDRNFDLASPLVIITLISLLGDQLTSTWPRTSARGAWLLRGRARLDPAFGVSSASAGLVYGPRSEPESTVADRQGPINRPAAVTWPGRLRNRWLGQTNQALKGQLLPSLVLYEFRVSVDPGTRRQVLWISCRGRPETRPNSQVQEIVPLAEEHFFKPLPAKNPDHD